MRKPKERYREKERGVEVGDKYSLKPCGAERCREISFPITPVVVRHLILDSPEERKGGNGNKEVSARTHKAARLSKERRLVPDVFKYVEKGDHIT